MNSEAFAVWSSLFDDGVKTAWITECRELKPAAMVLYALKRELRKLEVKFDAKLNSYKQKISSQNCSKIDDNSKCQTLFPIVKYRNSTVDDQSFLESSVLTNTTELSELDQPILETDINNSNNDVTTVSPLKSPKINKNKTVFNKRKKSAQLTPSVLQFNKPNDTKSADIMDGSLNLLRLNTPKRTETIPDFLESSIIENTPLQMNLKKRKKKEASKNQISKNATLTQMFANEAALPIGNTSKQDTSEAGSMNIDEILDFINQCEGEEVEKVCGGKADSNETCVPGEKQIFANYIYKPETVRGKARYDLPGWSCRQCRDFYEALGLSPEELQVKMNECSKHRNKFAPADDTPPGFWDMTLPPTPGTFCE